ncbi:topoisomerase C-terminal repeat-containing protein, partial [Novacetimonas hansenii]|uniref:topoisomerase C-terminal repeat-containing protein n=1 Tax=Novacetimonas hansenii TaxID=436 RepID=UPI0039E7ABAC
HPLRGHPANASREGGRGRATAPAGAPHFPGRRGPWGLYVQLGEPDPEDKKAKPKRATIPRGIEGDKITLEQAVGLLSLPRIVGMHPETGEPIEAGLGRFGPYVKMGAVYGSLDKDDDVLTVGLNRAVDALAKKLASIRTIGPHPKDGEPVMVRKGRFGPYAQHGQIVATLPRGQDMNDVTMDEALALLAEKGKPLKPKGKTTKAKAAPRKARTTRAKAADADALADGDAPAKPARKTTAKKATTTKKAAPKKAATPRTRKATTAKATPDKAD